MKTENHEFVSVSLGADPQAPYSCRVHDNSFHVDYIVEEKDDTEIEYYGDQVETENITHREVAAVDDSLLETGWVLGIEQDKARLLISENESYGFDIDQRISAQTCLQLADMFRRAGELLLQRESIKKEEDAKVQQIIDSQRLPFTETGLFEPKVTNRSTRIEEQFEFQERHGE